MATHKRSTRRSLRLRLLALLLVPLSSLAMIWAFGAYVTTRDALAKYDASTTFHKIAVPGIPLTGALQLERGASVPFVSTARLQGRSTVVRGRAATDAMVAAFRRSVLSAAARRTSSPLTRQRLAELLKQLDGLSGIRLRVDAGTLDAMGTIDAYDALIDSFMHLYSGLVVINDLDVYREGLAIVNASKAQDLVAREDALVTAALTSRAGKLTAPEYATFVQSANNERNLFDTGMADLTPNLRGPLGQMAASPGFTALRTLEGAIVSGGAKASLAPTALSWRAAVGSVMAVWGQALTRTGAALADEAKPIGDRINFLLYVAGGLGLVAVALSIAVSARFGRSLSRELTVLQRTALQLANERLPRVIKRLRESEKVDVAAEAPRIYIGTSKEVANVADALNTLQRTAIEAAIGEAHLRESIHQVVRNIAWRNQALLHRQLAMLDAMELQASEPDALKDLFALDHLTTRMRRHAEGLVILSGAPPARGWHQPVPIHDVLRAAIAEVEDYTRVIVEAGLPAALAGDAVADVTHLLAELIENATSFSPPDTRVRVRGEPVAKGYVVEVEDGGIGMSPQELAESNARVTSSSEFDIADSNRLGLFIVGTLAARRGIRVTLRSSPYGGVQAVVLIPSDLITRDRGSDDENGSPNELVAESGRLPAASFESPPPLPPDTSTRTTAPVPRDAGVTTEPTSADVGQISPPPSGVDSRTRNAIRELPRRVPQANLAPQLRQDSSAHTPAGNDIASPRTPEETRSRLESLQNGWRRGRDEDFEK
jgi:signal transduction histidine kinase